MAFDNTEIEIKVKISQDEYLKIKSLLDDKAIFLKTATHVDNYYTPSQRNFSNEQYPYEWLSIRQRGDHCILNYKHFFPEGAEQNTHCKEYETVVSNPDNLQVIFNALEIKHLVTVKKLRRTYEFLKVFEVVLDEVEELGYFIEIEAKEIINNINETKESLKKLLNEFDLDMKNIVHRGYPYQLLNKE